MCVGGGENVRKCVGEIESMSMTFFIFIPGLKECVRERVREKTRVFIHNWIFSHLFI